MRKLWVAMAVVVLGSTVWSRQAGAMEQPPATKKAVLTGYKGARWGMSPAEVQQLAPGGLALGDLVQRLGGLQLESALDLRTYHVNEARVNGSWTRYFFDDGRLLAVEVRLPKVAGGGGVELILQKLASEYGVHSRSESRKCSGFMAASRVCQETIWIWELEGGELALVHEQSRWHVRSIPLEPVYTLYFVDVAAARAAAKAEQTRQAQRQQQKEQEAARALDAVLP